VVLGVVAVIEPEPCPARAEIRRAMGPPRLALPDLAAAQRTNLAAVEMIWPALTA